MGSVDSAMPQPLNPRECPGNHCVGGQLTSGLVWTGVENLTTIGIRSLDRPAHCELLYWLHYHGPKIFLKLLPKFQAVQHWWQLLTKTEACCTSYSETLQMCSSDGLLLFPLSNFYNAWPKTSHIVIKSNVFKGVGMAGTIQNATLDEKEGLALVTMWPQGTKSALNSI